MKLFYVFLCLGFLTNFICIFENKNKQMNNPEVSNPDSTETKEMNKFNDIRKEAFQLHYDAIVVDSHNDILMPIMINGADININNLSTQSDFVKWSEGGLDVQIFSIYVPEKYKRNHFSYAMKLIDKLENISSTSPDKFRLTNNYDSLMKYLNENMICGLMGIEGGNIIEGSLDNLVTLHNRGVIYMGLTWNTSNEIAISARDESERGKNGGLTEFGKQVVKKMDELGMLIDVSHLGETAFWDVLEITNNPIIASHSCVYNLAPHYRNLKDEQIKAIAKSSGYIGINFFSKFLDRSANQKEILNIQQKYKNAINNFDEIDKNNFIEFNERRYEYFTLNKSDKGISIDVLIDHIDYIVKLVGADYVGLGSDFDGSIYTPNELYDATCYPVITKKLTERGYSEGDIRKILGLNFLRVFKQVCK